MHNNDHLSLATSDQQIVLFYNSTYKNHREIHAYAAAAQKPVLAIDVSKTKVAATVWTEVADLLKCEVKDLIKTEHSSYIEKYGQGTELGNNDAINMLQQDPDMLLVAIMVWGHYAREVELYGHAVQFFNRDTAAVRIP
ncbi:MAG: hypothetical protein WBA16_06790 [Nonlabens sp.]